MKRRIRLGLMALAAVGLAAIPLQPRPVSAQQPSSRWRVMVPEIQPQAGGDKKFGERLAEQLRDRINEMPRHRPIEEKELKNALKEYDLDMEDLNCARARQLGPLIDAQVMFCGSYTVEGDNARVDAEFISPEGEEFRVDPITVPLKDGGPGQAADHFVEALQLQSEQRLASQFCADYYTSKNYEESIAQCDKAIDLNPNATGTRFVRAMDLKALERYEESLEELKTVLDLDAVNTDAMQNAGWLAATLGRDEEARDFYRSYLELNPGNVRVRTSVAYDLAKAGDPLGAMQFIEEGLAIEPDNADLLVSHGDYAYAAATDAAQGQETLPPEAGELYRKALDSYGKVYAAQGSDTDSRILLNMVRAHAQLQQFQEAVDLASQALQTHPDEAPLWSVYADALQRNGQVDEAIQALQHVEQLDPEYPNLAARQGAWLLGEGRIDEAIPALQDAITRGEQTADKVGAVLLSEAVNNGINAKDWAHAISILRHKDDLDLSDMMQQQMSFWLGYAIFQDAQAQQEPRTLETAKATLPRFQEVLRLMQASADYAQRNNYEKNRQEVIQAANVFIEVQEAIIKRGGRY